MLVVAAGVLRRAERKKMLRSCSLVLWGVRCAVHNRPDEDLIVVLWSLLNARNRTFPVVK